MRRALDALGPRVARAPRRHGESGAARAGRGRGACPGRGRPHREPV